MKRSMTSDALAALTSAGLSRRVFVKGSGALIVAFSAARLAGDLGIAPESAAAQGINGPGSTELVYSLWRQSVQSISQKGVDLELCWAIGDPVSIFPITVNVASQNASIGAEDRLLKLVDSLCNIITDNGGH